jgi:hypothetical protein
MLGAERLDEKRLDVTDRPPRFGQQAVGHLAQLGVPSGSDPVSTYWKPNHEKRSHAPA